MSPEQVRGKELDARTDLFSFGAVLYEMCTSTLPFRGDTSGVIFESILNRAPASAVRLNPGLPVELERIVNKALEKDRDVRYQHAADLRADLKRLRRETESGKTVAGVAAPSRWSRRTMLIGAVALVFAIAVIAVAAFYLGSSSRAPSSRSRYYPSRMPAVIRTGILERRDHGGCYRQVVGTPKSKGHLAHICVPLQAA